MKKIGIITYHSAYNFGSTLQAYATQEALKKLGYDCEIINYRMPEQKYYYEKNIRIRYGVKSTIKDILQLQNYKKRKQRANGYERFIHDFLMLSPEFNEPEQVMKYWNRYDLIVSGSDQIWNKHSNELHRSSWNYMYPYTLMGYRKGKVSYASSVGNMICKKEIQILIKMITGFDSISFREKKSSDEYSKLLKRSIQTVLDPTFLLNANDWIRRLRLKKNNRKYILYYDLAGLNGYKNKMRELSRISSKYGIRIVVVTPLVSIPGKYHGLEFHPEYSTLEFMDAIYNADSIITDSYHGSILSVNLGKDVYSICGDNGSDFRKTDLFQRLGLEDRLITGLKDKKLLSLSPIDYDKVNMKLSVFRKDSLSYLKNAIEDSLNKNR